MVERNRSQGRERIIGCRKLQRKGRQSAGFASGREVLIADVRQVREGDGE